MNTPFVEAPLQEFKTKFKLFGKKPNPNAIVKLNNLLASKAVLDVTIKDVQSIVFEYRVNLKRNFPDDIRGFYQTYFEHCLDDKFLSDEEVKELIHLKRILTLNDKDVEIIHNKVAGRIYQKAVDDALEDNVLEPEEKAFLESLQKDLRLKSTVADKIYTDSASTILNNLIDEALEDVLLTPEEEMEISELAGKLHIDYTTDKHTSQELEKYKLFWQIENGDLPVLQLNYELQEEEVCHFKMTVNWMEEDAVVSEGMRSSAEMNEKIASGIYWKTADLGSYELASDQWKMPEQGTILITNKRVVFFAENNFFTEIPLEYISDFIAYNNGVELYINKDALHPFIKFEKNIDLFSIILGNAILNNENGFSNDGE